MSKYTLDKFEVPGRPNKIARLLDETIYLSCKNGLVFVKTAMDYEHGTPYSSDVSAASAVSEIVKAWLKSKSEYIKYERNSGNIRNGSQSTRQSSMSSSKRNCSMNLGLPTIQSVRSCSQRLGSKDTDADMRKCTTMPVTLLI